MCVVDDEPLTSAPSAVTSPAVLSIAVSSDVSSAATTQAVQTVTAASSVPSADLLSSSAPSTMSLSTAPTVASSAAMSSVAFTSTKSMTDGILPYDEVKQLVEEHLGCSESNHIHNFFICKANNCSSFINSAAACKERGKDKFQHNWLQDKNNWWAVFDESKRGVFCILCTKHKTKSSLNKTLNTYIDTPSTRFKAGVLKEHFHTGIHGTSVTNELLQRASSFHKDYTFAKERENTILEKAFEAAYFVMKHHLPNKKFVPLLELMQRCGVEEISYFNHKSEGSVKDIFLKIGEAVQESFLGEVRQGESFGLLVDEATDISTMAQMVIFVQYVDPDGNVDVKFLGIRDLLKDFDSANAEAIFQTLKTEVESKGLKFENLMGFASDGARVMTGHKTGVAAKIKAENKTCISIHCVCHKLALACASSVEDLAYLKKVETTLRQLWQWFENSPKRLAAFLKVQQNLKQAQVSNKAEKILLRRLKKACTTRWLSFENSVSSLKKEYHSVLLTLQMFLDDAAATGLLSKLRQEKFLGAVYILNEILPKLATLSRTLQYGKMNFSQIQPAVEMTKDQLKTCAKESKAFDDMEKDVDGLQLFAEVSMSRRAIPELETLQKKYITSLVNNIDDRFSKDKGVLRALHIFNPLELPAVDSAEFKCYGKEEAKELAIHFFDDSVKQDDFITQWQHFKYYMTENVKVPENVKKGSTETPTTWLLGYLLRNKAMLTPFFKLLIFVAEVALIIPVSNAWPERGFSAMKLVKSRLRSSLQNNMLNALLSVLINGPPADQASKIIKRAVQMWLDAKVRRKLPPSKVHIVGSLKPDSLDKPADVPNPVPADSADVPNLEAAPSTAVPKPVLLPVDVEVDQLGLLFNIPSYPSDEDSDSAFESDCDSDIN